MASIVSRAVNRTLRRLMLKSKLIPGRRVVVNEFPRSGGTWVGQMVARALDLTFPRNATPPLGDCLLHCHSIDTRTTVADWINVWRDGRDVMVSWFFHCTVPNDVDNQRLVNRVRRDLSIDEPDIDEHLAAFIEYSCSRMPTPGFSWPRFVDTWIDAASIHIKYEELRNNPLDELSSVVARLDPHPPPRDELAAIVDEFSFQRQAGRQPGTEKAGRFLRKGVVGDWTRRFSPEARQAFDHYAGDQLIRLGYETDHDWVSG